MTDQYPTPLSVLPDSLPDDIRISPRWVVWKLEWNGKKWTKVPYQLDGRKASVTDPTHWCSFEDALYAYRRPQAPSEDDFGVTPPEWNGIGFVLSNEDDLIAIDLDGCISDDGTLDDWAQNLVDRMATYTEYSPSGRGVRMFIYGRLPQHGRRKGQIEIYETERYVTCTGHRLERSPLSIQERQAELTAWHAEIWPPTTTVQPVETEMATLDDQALIAAIQADSGIAKLYTGDTTGYQSASDADWGFLRRMIEGHTRDAGQLDRIYRTSGLMRAKWDKKHGSETYGEMTIRKALAAAAEQPPGILDGADGYPYTDNGNGLRLVARHQHRIRFVPDWKKWLFYRNGRWDVDAADKRCEWLARQVGKTLATEGIAAVFGNADKTKALLAWSKHSESYSAVRACILSAGSDARVMINHEQLDADPYLFNLRNGTIDMRTSEVHAHTPDDLLVSQAAVDYDPEATCPLWDAMLERILPDPEVRAFLQRLASLTLVGRQQEAVMPFLVGNGANGKTTLTKVIAGVLGDYATVASHDILLIRRTEAHPTSRADLFRKRFAYCSEIRGGARLDEAQIKELTGGDKIKARRMGENFWEFEPTHLLWLHANYKPVVDGTDDGIWRRVVLIPFEVQIPLAEQDSHLGDRILDAERAGVLNWLLAGYADYQAQGLNIPEAVRVAGADYRSKSDTVGAFLAANGFVFDESLEILAAQIKMAHSLWYPVSGVRMLEEAHYQKVVAFMQERGAVSHRSAKARSWKGIGLAEDLAVPQELT